MEQVKTALKWVYVVVSSLVIMGFSYWSFMWVTDFIF